MNGCSDHPPTHAGVCRNLKSIVVQIGIEDYFEDPNSPEARKLFDEMVNKLQVQKEVIFTPLQAHCHHEEEMLSYFWLFPRDHTPF